MLLTPCWIAVFRLTPQSQQILDLGARPAPLFPVTHADAPPGEGIAQILFLRGEGVCKTSYGDKRGKYQDQKGLTLPIVQQS